VEAHVTYLTLKKKNVTYLTFFFYDDRMIAFSAATGEAAAEVSLKIQSKRY
jgi:hypothetical protein